MIFWFLILLLLGFGVVFRLGTKPSRMGWLTWAIPLVLQGLLRMGQVTESDAFLSLYLLIFASGGLLCGVGIQLHKFFAARR